MTVKKTRSDGAGDVMSEGFNNSSSPNALEQAIVRAWRRVLHVEHIGPDDNFFDLGGDSLKLLAVHSGLQKTLEVEIAVLDLFEFTTVRQLAAHLAHISQVASKLTEDRKLGERQRTAFALLRERRIGNSNESSSE